MVRSNKTNGFFFELIFRCRCTEFSVCSLAHGHAYDSLSISHWEQIGLGVRCSLSALSSTTAQISHLAPRTARHVLSSAFRRVFCFLLSHDEFLLTFDQRPHHGHHSWSCRHDYTSDYARRISRTCMRGRNSDGDSGLQGLKPRDHVNHLRPFGGVLMPALSNQLSQHFAICCVLGAVFFPGNVHAIAAFHALANSCIVRYIWIGRLQQRQSEKVTATRQTSRVSNSHRNTPNE